MRIRRLEGIKRHWSEVTTCTSEMEGPTKSAISHCSDLELNTPLSVILMTLDFMNLTALAYLAM